ncbi:UNVERIFIED_CONTAM: hypothetical protein GTU68_055730 [Idotea baltica]|nr:hypothetical protein [Idotea baltica]
MYLHQVRLYLLPRLGFQLSFSARFLG